ncbi:hypothetical protein ACK4AA_21510, partial [Aeromonas veronii]
MSTEIHTPSRSAFDAAGFTETIRFLVDRTKSLYLSDQIPWVIGYSGGKDSTAILQLVVSIHRNSIDTGKMRRSSLDPTFLLA